MPRIGLGLAALGRPAYITAGRAEDLGLGRSVEEMERRCHLMLDHAWANGIRHVDAARSYGKSEEFLASWLKARRIEKGMLVVSSKWGYRYEGNWRLDARVHEVKDLSVGALRRQIAETRAILGDHLDLYQVHSATVESGVLEDAAVLGELARLRSEGLNIGLTVTGPGQSATIRQALNVRVAGVNPFRAVQATWNVLEPSAGPALAEAHTQGWEVIVKEVVANGRLTDRHAPADSAISAFARSIGATLDAAAVAAALVQPWVGSVLSGAVTTEQLDSHLRAFNFVDKLSDLPLVAEPPAEYWTRRGEVAWA